MAKNAPQAFFSPCFLPDGWWKNGGVEAEQLNPTLGKTDALAQLVLLQCRAARELPEAP